LLGQETPVVVMLGLSYQKVGCLDSRFGLGGWEKACLIYALLGR